MTVAADGALGLMRCGVKCANHVTTPAEIPPPTVDEFRTFTTEAFAFLASEYGFVRSPLVSSDDVNPYVVEFSGNGIVVKVMGIMWGVGAQVTLRRSGEPRLELPMFLLMPERDQPSNVTISASSQLNAVAMAAGQLKRWGDTALRGNLTELQRRFAEYCEILRAAEASKRDRTRIEKLIAEAKIAAKQKEFSRVVGLLGRERDLPPFALKLLEYARKRQ